MPIDSSIPLGVRPAQIESPVNMLGQVLQLQGTQSQNALAQYSINKAQRQDEETNRLAQLLAGGGVDLSSPEGIAKAYSVAPTMAGTYIKNQLDQKKTVSDISLNDAKSKLQTNDAVAKAVSTQRDALAGVNTPQDAAAWMQAAYANPDLKPLTGSMPLDQALARVPTDPAQFQQWKQQMALGATKFIELNKPNIQVRNTGGTTDVLAIPGLGGAPQTVASVKNTVSPDASLQASTSRANNAANIAKDLQVAGMAPGGGIDDNAERTAQAIANGQLPAPTGMALLNPRNQRILGRVMEINPQYDATSVTAKKAAATAFASGPLGNQLRSVSTANAHLDQLGELADAMQNGNLQIANKVGNYFATQTGNPQATNFDAIKNIVGQEVVKAIIAGGGSMTEREDAAKIFSSASSPAQLKGAIQHYRMVMGAQANNLLEQRRAAGLPDSTLPDYGKTNSAPNPVTSAIDAELARRGGK